MGKGPQKRFPPDSPHNPLICPDSRSEMEGKGRTFSRHAARKTRSGASRARFGSIGPCGSAAGRRTEEAEFQGAAKRGRKPLKNKKPAAKAALNGDKPLSDRLLRRCASRNDGQDQPLLRRPAERDAV